MHRNVTLIAGLCCLAVLFTGCDRSSVMPPVDPGIVTITDDGDGTLYSNEPVVISWKGIPYAETYLVSYSSDEITWIPVGETKEGNLQLKWRTPTGITSLKVRVEGCGLGGINCPPAYSGSLGVTPFGDLDTIEFTVVPSSIYPGGVFDFQFVTKDKWGNIIMIPQTAEWYILQDGMQIPCQYPELSFDTVTGIYQGEFMTDIFMPQGAILTIVIQTDETSFRYVIIPTIVSLLPLSVEEGRTGVLVFSLSEPVTESAVLVDYATADGTAIAWIDYRPLMGTAIFLPGETETKVIVSTTVDNVKEINETFVVELTNPIGAVIDTPSTIITIIDND